MNISTVIQAIERLAPPFLQASWDCSGLQVASTRREVRKMAICLDAVPDLVEKALDMDCDFILSHHPLSLKAELPNRLNSYRRILQLLLSANVPLYAAHTSLDVNINGPAGFLGRALGLQNTVILDPVSAPTLSQAYGYGQVGDLPQAESLGMLGARLMELLNIDVVPVCGLHKKSLVRSIAYCGGSASSLAPKAMALGADVFITGDVKYHSALESDICMLDVGHYSMEVEMMRHMTRSLGSEMADLEIVFLLSPDPFEYIYKV